ncbi:MAG: patatin-like phospholipase family protein, partial [Vicingaceae bacterium]|nr:patatin-like phospholipase family protein [Vicingaceae bacterium]
MNKSVALVLSSGGSRGLAQIGVINALEENDFQISSIAGSSIGSVIGGLHAMGKLPEFTAWMKTLDRRAI